MPIESLYCLSGSERMISKRSSAQYLRAESHVRPTLLCHRQEAEAVDAGSRGRADSLQSWTWSRIRRRLCTAACRKRKPRSDPLLLLARKLHFWSQRLPHRLMVIVAIRVIVFGGICFDCSTRCFAICPSRSCHRLTSYLNLPKHSCSECECTHMSVPTSSLVGSSSARLETLCNVTTSASLNGINYIYLLAHGPMTRQGPRHCLHLLQLLLLIPRHSQIFLFQSTTEQPLSQLHKASNPLQSSSTSNRTVVRHHRSLSVSNYQKFTLQRHLIC